MVNRNGSNNGNGSANGVHKDTAVLAENGNGHRPDAATLTEHDPALNQKSQDLGTLFLLCHPTGGILIR